MTITDSARQARFRAASAGLAAALETGVEGGTGSRPPTANERWLLAALARAGGNAAPAELIRAYPDRFPGADDPDGPQVRSYTSSLHRTGRSLIRKGLATRGRRQIDRHGDGVKSGGPVLYRITAEGRQACRS